VGATDLALAAVILAGAGWLLYRSLWKAGGPCRGCAGGGCARGRSAPAALVDLRRR
jgi:hypothetical protein